MRLRVAAEQLTVEPIPSEQAQPPESVSPFLQQLEEMMQSHPGSEEEKLKFRDIIIRNIDAFAQTEEDVGCTSAIHHRINLIDDVPVSQPYRRIPPAQLEEVRKHIDELLRNGSIIESTSPYAAPVVVVRKKSGSIRLCCDYRSLNGRNTGTHTVFPVLRKPL